MCAVSAIKSVALFLIVTVGGICSSPPTVAQSRAEVGVFIDYLGVSQTSTNNVGMGGRFGYRIRPKLILEGEIAYDYGINFQEAFRNVVNGNMAAIESTSIGVTHGLFGPTLQRATGGFRPFVTLKGGLVDFRLSPSLIPLNGAESAILGLRTSSLNAAVYPAGGVEVSLGPLGLRFELGDEVYFNSGAHQDLRFTFGPILRF